ncbi:MAG: amidohydrolase [Blastopirellula sp.]|nr:MAG: amidohydrolase [Blastopirellula sp.]
MPKLNWQSELSSEINRLEPRLIELRRELHQNPEPSGEEYKTSLTIYQALSELGYQVRMGSEGRGVIADWPEESKNQPAVYLALRADIDALRIHDKKQVPYRSQCEGLMHACGHDAHTALVFGALAALKKLNEKNALPWPIRVRGIFQPAEETCEGAKMMIDVGALENVGGILATHMDPGLSYGKVGIRKGALTASCDSIVFNIFGSSGHGARPHEANDPIAAAAQLINALYLSIPRVTDTQDAVVLSFGKIAGGQNSNVIPETVSLEGTLRTLDPKVRETTIAHINRIAAGIGQATETKIEMKIDLGTDAVINNKVMNGFLKQACIEVMGPEAVHKIPRASMGGEDFSFYLNHVPGAMIRLGCTRPDATERHMLHSTLFDIDERVLKNGAQLLASAVIRAFDADEPWLKNQQAGDSGNWSI